jgi:hypothetical protein
MHPELVGMRPELVEGVRFAFDNLSPHSRSLYGAAIPL